MAVMMPQTLHEATLGSYVAKIAYFEAIAVTLYMYIILVTHNSVSTKKRPPPKYNGVVFEILGRHHWNFYNRI